VTTSTLRARKRDRTRQAIAEAALRLFGEGGFDAVTLAQVAEAADVGQRTLFRYFSDKEELLFDSDEQVQARLFAALAARPDHEPPAAAVQEAVISLVPLWQDFREQGRQRRAVIAASAALQARERAKHAAHERVLADGLVTRGASPQAARLLARVAVACAVEAAELWLEDGRPDRPGLERRMRDTFTELTRQLNGAPSG
jgi:AcrR family transcriptional regulator